MKGKESCCGFRFLTCELGAGCAGSVTMMQAGAYGVILTDRSIFLAPAWNGSVRAHCARLADRAL